MGEFLVVDCSGFVLLFICWLVISSFTRRAQKRSQQYHDQIAFVYQQVEELYRPLLFLLGECHQLEQAALSQHEVAPAEVEEDWSVREPAGEHMPNVYTCSGHIIRLLLQKAPLLEGGKLPYSFQHFVAYRRAWRARWSETGALSLAWPVWPWQFEQELITTCRDLQQKHRILLCQLLPQAERHCGRLFFHDLRLNARLLHHEKTGY